MGYFDNRYDEQQMKYQPGMLGDDYSLPQQSMSGGSMDAASTGSGGAAAGAPADAAASGSPGMAAAGVGASFLQGYLAQRAAEFEKRRQAQVDNAKNYQTSQDQSLQNLNQTWRGALR